jgi:hypothetical protein
MVTTVGSPRPSTCDAVAAGDLNGNAIAVIGTTTAAPPTPTTAPPTAVMLASRRRRPRPS